MISVKVMSPLDVSLKVSIINATAADFNTLSVSMSRMEQNLGGEITARLLGFLRPPQVWENTREQLRICVSHSAATLRLDSLTSHLVCTLQSFTVTTALRSSLALALSKKFQSQYFRSGVIRCA